MKIVLAAKAAYPFHGFGGVQKYVYYLAKYLSKEGADVEIVTSYSKTFQKERQRYNNGFKDSYEGIKYHFLPPYMEEKIERSTGWLWMHYWSKNLADYLKSYQYDILHGFELAPFYSLFRKKKNPVVYQLFLDTHRVRSVNRVQVRSYFSPWTFLSHPTIYALKLLPVKYCLEASDLVATEGEFQDDELVEDFAVDRKKLFPIRIGVDLEKIRQSFNGVNTYSRMKLGLDEDDVLAISVNRFIPEKGLSTLIQALAVSSKKLPNLKLLLVGQGILEKELLALAENLKVRNRLIHLREVAEEDLYVLYRLADMYVSPTLQDDYIMGIQEAMACSLPVISTGQRWLVFEGVNGWIVPKHDPHAMASAMCRLAENSQVRSTFGKESAQIIERFDWQQIARETMIRYQEIIRV